MIITLIQGVLCGLNVVIHAKYLERRLAHSKLSVSIVCVYVLNHVRLFVTP